MVNGMVWWQPNLESDLYRGATKPEWDQPLSAFVVATPPAETPPASTPPPAATTQVPPAMPAPPAAIDPPPRAARDALDKAAPSRPAITVPLAVAPNAPVAPIDAAIAGAAIPAVATPASTPIAIDVLGFSSMKSVTASTLLLTASVTESYASSKNHFTSNQLIFTPFFLVKKETSANYMFALGQPQSESKEGMFV
ncbi:hypothetical protein [Enterobacter hormaechei]